MSTSASALMLSREYLSMKKHSRSNYFTVYGLNDDNIHEWIVYIIGPPQTSYAGACYKAIMRFPTNFPNDPPSIQFTSNVYHPNIHRDGKVCISTLQHPSPGSKSGAEYWRPVLGVEQALLSVVSLLSDANIDDPANPEAAMLLKDHPARFKEKVRRHAELSRDLLPDDFMFPVVVASGRDQTVAAAASNGDDDGDEGEEEEENYVYSDDEWEMDEVEDNAVDSECDDDEKTNLEKGNGKCSALPSAEYGDAIDVDAFDDNKSEASVKSVVAIENGNDYGQHAQQEDTHEATNNNNNSASQAVDRTCSTHIVISDSSASTSMSEAMVEYIHVTQKRCLGDTVVGNDDEEVLVAQRGPKLIRHSDESD